MEARGGGAMGSGMRRRTGRRGGVAVEVEGGEEGGLAPQSRADRAGEGVGEGGAGVGGDAARFGKRAERERRGKGGGRGLVR